MRERLLLIFNHATEEELTVVLSTLDLDAGLARAIAKARPLGTLKDLAKMSGGQAIFARLERFEKQSDPRVEPTLARVAERIKNAAAPAGKSGLR